MHQPRPSGERESVVVDNLFMCANWTGPRAITVEGGFFPGGTCEDAYLNKSKSTAGATGS